MKIAVIGCGVMGSAFARHLAKKNSVILCDRNKERGESFASEISGIYCENLSDAVSAADVVILAVKPKDLATVAGKIALALTDKKILVSILAGTPIAVLKHYFPLASVVRTMPNMGLVCGEGVMGFAEEGGLSAETREIVDSLFDGIGLKIWMNEHKIEAITALSGSGIGFVLVFIEAMIDGGVHLGFSSGESREIVLKTIEGAVALMKGSGKHPAELKLQISSPGGTTIAGLKMMEESGVRAGIIKTLAASHEKALNMAKNLKID